MNQKTVLIVGGAGYIGSHTSWLLHKQGYKIVVLDSFLHNQNFNQPWAKLVKSDFADTQTLNHIFTNHEIDCVMHFAAFIEVGESVKKPKEFYQNNVIKTLTLLNTMVEHGVKKIIFSSSCAVYGVPQKLPLEETHPLNPINPYGKNKLAVEYALQDYSSAYDLRYVSLRYFNASGALPEMGLGEQHVPETHIIPLLLRAAKNNSVFNIFGDDYTTTDGSCIRDYVHVLDIARAHVFAYQHIESGNESNYFNLGSETGFSVIQLINAAEKICNTKIKIQLHPRRTGDVAALIANSSKAESLLGWRPQHSDIQSILQSALSWENSAKNLVFLKNAAFEETQIDPR